MIFSEALSVAEERVSYSTRAPKLLDRLREALHTRHYSRRTEQTYCHWIKRFILLAQQAEISMVMTDAIFVLQASYTALIAAFGILCGSI